MLSEREIYLDLKAENEKLKNIIKYLDSKNKTYLDFMRKLNITLTKKQLKQTDFDYPGEGVVNIACETISMPEMVITYSIQQELSKMIQEVLLDK